MRVALLLVLVGVLSCGRTSRSLHGGSGSSGGQGGGSTGSQSASTASGTGGAAGEVTSTSGGGVGGMPGGAGPVEPTCTVDTAVDAPIRRLTRFEYNNTVRDVLGDSSRPAESLPFDGLPPDGSRVPDATLSAALVEGYHQLAHDYAERVTADDAGLSDLTGCNPESDGEEVCRESFIAEFVGRIFRRPATEEELEEFAGVFATGQSLGGDFASGVRAVVEVGLQSPEFLYRPELGESVEGQGSASRPTSYEMASRLSYLLWGAAPDQKLLEAASRNELATPEQVEAAARRLLEDPRAADAIGHFYLRLLRVLDADFPAVLDPAFPSFTPEIAGLMLEETKAFTAELTLSGDGDFESLWSAPYTFVNGPLAAYYGVDGISDSVFQRVELDPSRRAGLLTQGSFLGTTARGPFTDPSRRGALILTSLLCTSIPFEPPGTGLPPEPLPPNTTTRDRLQQQVADVVCTACHAHIDPIGFALEHFDAAGLWRDVENGVAIDASGEISTTDAMGSFEGARELSLALASSQDARRCFIENWFIFAHGRAPTPEDRCTLETLEQAFADEGENLKELLVALTQTKAFLQLPEASP